MPQPNMRYLLMTSVQELAASAIALEPELRNRGPEITRKLTEWARENNLSAQAVTIALIHWLSMGTEEAENVSQV